jgi:lysophospholipase L1-like esterase
VRHGLVLALALAGCRPEPAPAPSLATDPGAASLVAPPATPALEPPPPPPRPFTTPEIRAARELAQRRVLGDGAELLADLDPAGSPVRGRFSPLIVPPGVDPLAHFHAALARLQSGAPEQPKLRVVVYGASGTAADLWTAYLRTYLQTRFGDGGPGFVPPVRHRAWSRHSEYRIDSSKRWSRHQSGSKTASPGGHYGLAGIAMAAEHAGATGSLTPAPRATSSRGVDTFELFYLVQPEGGRISVQIDDLPAEIVDTRGPLGPGYRRFTLPPGPHGLALRTLDRREVRVFGVVAERPDRGVVLDTLGIDGAGAAVHLGADEALWTDNLRRRAPDLYILAYGTNEAFDSDFDADRFGGQLRELTARLRRAAPGASCVLMSPGDHGRPGSDPGPAERLGRVREIELAVAAEAGCALWDALDFMGGPGAMADWVNADPPLARPDHVHATARGAVLTAMALADALLLQHDRTQVDTTPDERVALP